MKELPLEHFSSEFKSKQIVALNNEYKPITSSVMPAAILPSTLNGGLI